MENEANTNQTVQQTAPSGMPVGEAPAVSVSQTSQKSTFSKIPHAKIVLPIIFLIIVLVSIPISLLFFYNNKTKDKVFVEQNMRLKGFPQSAKIDPESPELIEGRKKILEYARLHNITVTDDEITARKKKLIAATSEEEVGKTMVQYGWTQKDWTEVVRWQLLREKILILINPSRYGEVLSVRWDAFSPVLDQKNADEKKGIAIKYLTQVKEKLILKSIDNFYSAYQNFDIKKDPIFKGVEDKYALQYSGWDDKEKTYKQFLLSKDSPDYTLIMTSKPPIVTDVKCTLGGCLFYNIISGTNGDSSSDEILKLLTDKGIVF